jgi:hypothetical protein
MASFVPIGSGCRPLFANVVTRPSLRPFASLSVSFFSSAFSIAHFVRCLHLCCWYCEFLVQLRVRGSAAIARFAARVKFAAIGRLGCNWAVRLQLGSSAAIGQFGCECAVRLRVLKPTASAWFGYECVVRLRVRGSASSAWFGAYRQSFSSMRGGGGVPPARGRGGEAPHTPLGSGVGGPPLPTL